MPSRLTVVLVSLLLATPTLIFWLLLVILPERMAIRCPLECSCGPDGYYVDCSGTSLNSIPSILPTHVRILLLDNNNLTYFPNDSFVSKGLVDLQILDAKLCELRIIEFGAFNGLKNLMHLSLQRNEISEIISGTFVNIRLLEYLDLSYNRIKHLEIDVFSGLVNLKQIVLEGNKLQYLHPDTFSELPNLLNLNLKCKEISEIIPGTLENIRRSENLKPSYNKTGHSVSNLFSSPQKYIQSVREAEQPLLYSAAVYPNLENIYLSYTLGLKIPTERHFINSHSLKQLDISGCGVRFVSVESFANVSALESLNLTYNNLISVDINIFKALPKLSTLYLYGNPLHCDCKLQKLWRWCQDHNIQTAYKGIAAKCDTPRKVKGLGWGVLENVQCLGNKIRYYGDYKNASHRYTLIEDLKENTEEERKQFCNFLLPVAAIFFIFGTTFNIIIIIIITHNKDMQTVPNMYIFNLAVSDIITLTLNFFYANVNRFPDIWPQQEIRCVFLPFCYILSIGLTAYSIAVYSIQRYRATVNPLQFYVSSQPTWRSTGATICGVWIVAAFFAIPAAQINYLFCGSAYFLHTMYLQLLTVYHLFVSCAFPLGVITFCYIKTARHLFESSRPISEETQNPQLNTRRNSAKVLLALTVVLLITHVPYYIYGIYFRFSLHPDVSVIKIKDLTDWAFKIVDITLIQRYFLSINSCVNPVALFSTSRAFKRHFKRYLTCCYKTNSPPTDFKLANRN